MTNSVEDLSDFVSGAISPYLELLTGEKWVLFKDKLNFKWPGGGGFTCHQDYPAYDLLGPAEHITAMIVIDDATDENGCLQVAENWVQVAHMVQPNSKNTKITHPFIQVPFDF